MTGTKKRTKLRWLWWSLGGFVVLLIIVLLPGKPSGCYLELGDYFNKTDGYTFTYIGQGRVFSCNEYANHPWDSGSYRYKDGVGWVFTLRGENRRALMKPHLLFIRFSDIDAGDCPVTAPFQLRNPFVWKTSPVLRRLKLGTSTNAAVLRPDSSYCLPNDSLPPTPASGFSPSLVAGITDPEMASTIRWESRCCAPAGSDEVIFVDQTITIANHSTRGMVKSPD